MRGRLLLCVAFFLVPALSSASEQATILEFELEDQFREVHRGSDFLGSVVVLVGSDRHGVESNDDWALAIRSGLEDHPRRDLVADLAYANLKGVPFFLKGTIRGKFPRDRESWVLMDWKGELFEAYGFAAGVSNVLVFGPDGSLVHQVSGTEPLEGDVAEVIEAIRESLDQIP